VELLSIAKMVSAVSLTPGFSPVQKRQSEQKLFQRFSRHAQAVETAGGIRRSHTRLKPGVNETGNSTLLIFANITRAAHECHDD
jgi:hypothetical protein